MYQTNYSLHEGEDHQLEHELHEVAADVQTAIEADDDDGNCEASGDYQRAITIEFPDDAALIHNVSRLEVPIRDVLTWLATHNPDDAKRIVALRDDFYSGDSEYDYGHYIHPCTDLSVTAERRAEARVTRERGRRAREVSRSILDAENEAARRVERGAWLPFLPERKMLQAEQEAHCLRADALDADWERFVHARQEGGTEGDHRNSSDYADLLARGRALLDDQEAWSERWADLQYQVLIANDRRR